jgi:hypothetical protein
MGSGGNMTQPAAVTKGVDDDSVEVAALKSDHRAGHRPAGTNSSPVVGGVLNGAFAALEEAADADAGLGLTALACANGLANLGRSARRTTHQHRRGAARSCPSDPDRCSMWDLDKFDQALVAAPAIPAQLSRIWAAAGSSSRSRCGWQKGENTDG